MIVIQINIGILFEKNWACIFNKSATLSTNHLFFFSFPSEKGTIAIITAEAQASNHLLSTPGMGNLKALESTRPKTNSAQTKSAQNQLGPKPSRPKTKSAQNQLGLKPSRPKTNSALPWITRSFSSLLLFPLFFFFFFFLFLLLSSFVLCPGNLFPLKKCHDPKILEIWNTVGLTFKLLL